MFRILICFFFYSVSSFANEGLTFYGKLYPQWRVDDFLGASTAGTVVGNLTTKKNDSDILISNAKNKSEIYGWDWSNSYVGLKGNYKNDGNYFGFNYQLLVDTNGSSGSYDNLKNNLDSRDAFFYIGNDRYGELSIGKMDTLYKEWGMRYRFLGISSGNFVGVSRILARTSWRGAGDTSFHNRRSNTFQYISPNFNQMNAGISYSYDEKPDGPGGENTRVLSLGVRKVTERGYFSLAKEIHYDWLPMSRGVTQPSFNSIFNDSRYTKSRDNSVRMTFGYRFGGYELGTDFASNKYTESSRKYNPGKFKSYHNYTAQFTLQYSLSSSYKFAYNYAIGSPGSCVLTGNVSCVTTNLGGYASSFGLMYKPLKDFGIFLTMSEVRNRPGSLYGSGPIGSNVTNTGVGVLVTF